jgi:hypothetical protein
MRRQSKDASRGIIVNSKSNVWHLCKFFNRIYSSQIEFTLYTLGRFSMLMAPWSFALFKLSAMSTGPAGLETSVSRPLPCNELTGDLNLNVSFEKDLGVSEINQREEIVLRHVLTQLLHELSLVLVDE